jgi:hypothetical protein
VQFSQRVLAAWRAGLCASRVDVATSWLRISASFPG